MFRKLRKLDLNLDLETTSFENPENLDSGYCPCKTGLGSFESINTTNAFQKCFPLFSHRNKATSLPMCKKNEWL
jgi:hypothetical protein